MNYRLHHLMTDPGAARPEVWRLLVGLVLSAVIWFGLARGLVAVLGSLMAPEAYMSLLEQLQSAKTPGSLLLVLVLTGTMGIAAMVAAEMLHHRPGLGLFGPKALFLRDFLRVAVAIVVLNLLVMILPPWGVMQATAPGVPPDLWLRLLPLTIVALLIQCAGEELFFRGYFQSQLAARFRHPAVWLIVPSAVFGMGHYVPELYGSNAGLVALWSALFGLAAADLTARAGNLGPALALHVVNNFWAFALMSMNGDMSGLALRQLPFGPEDTEAVAALLPVDLAMIGLGWLAARVVLRK